MPLKRKDTAATATSMGPKPKRNKPAFHSIQPTSSLNNTSISQAAPSSSKTRVATLRTNPTGRRGYYSQDKSTTSSSPPNPASDINSLSAAGNLSLASNLATSEPGNYSFSNSIPKTKAKNTTAVSNFYLFYIYITYTNIVKAY